MEDLYETRLVFAATCIIAHFIMIFELVPSSVWATEATSEPGAENVTTQEAEDLSVEGEVEALRTETENTIGCPTAAILSWITVCRFIMLRGRGITPHGWTSTIPFLRLWHK